MAFPRCWVFDENRREYRSDARGHRTGPLIWIKHWQEVTIVGETRVSWILDQWCTPFPKKRIPKAGDNRAVFDWAEVERRAWVVAHWTWIGARARDLFELLTRRPETLEGWEFDALKAAAAVLRVPEQPYLS